MALRNLFVVAVIASFACFGLTLISNAAEIVQFDDNWSKSPLFNVVSESSSGIKIIFSTHKMVVEDRVIDGTTMKTYSVPGIFLPGEEGAPNLAGTGRYIAIPHGAMVKMSILETRKELLHNVEIAPSPHIPFDNDDSPLRYKRDMKIYNEDAFYPASPVRVSPPMKIRGVDVVILRVNYVMVIFDHNNLEYS